MRIIVAALWLVLFLVLFAFAVNNTAATELHFFAGIATKAPLIALLLAFFVAGFAFGFVALMPAWARQRVELRRLRRATVRTTEATSVVRAPADGVPTANPLINTEIIQTVARGARATN